MKIKIFVSFFFVLGELISCQSQNDSALGSQRSIEPCPKSRENLAYRFKQKGDVIAIFDTISIDANHCIVGTEYLNDTIHEDLGDNIYQWPIMINQKIIFANSGKVVKEIDFGLIKDSIAGFKTADSSKKPITVWAHSFRQFNELKIYAIYASANCNGVKCPEYFSFFLENGECIFSGTTSDSSFAEKMKHSMDEYGIGELELDSLFESAIRVDYFYQ